MKGCFCFCGDLRSSFTRFAIAHPSHENGLRVAPETGQRGERSPTTFKPRQCPSWLGLLPFLDALVEKLGSRNFLDRWWDVSEVL